MTEQKPYTLLLGDVIEQLCSLPDNSVDSVCTDPPYELGFMGKQWDSTGIAYDTKMWKECLRVLKPGGHLLSFGGTRTYHRMASAVEDAGFEIRDQIVWLYGQGFPKSLDVSKAIDKAAGATREVVGTKVSRQPTGVAYAQYQWTKNHATPQAIDVTVPATDDAKKWDGWGTALKPAMEPIVVARKPLIGTVAQNVIEHGTGALNIGACRVGSEQIPSNKLEQWSGFGEVKRPDYTQTMNTGRWPANVIHDGSEELINLFPIDTARFFYCPKANKKDREEGNDHATVKPTDLMQYLCRLVTRPGGTVLDPFMGSGSTGKAAAREGFNFIGIDSDQHSFEIASNRVGKAYEVTNGN